MHHSVQFRSVPFGPVRFGSFLLVRFFSLRSSIPLDVTLCFGDRIGWVWIGSDRIGRRAGGQVQGRGGGLRAGSEAGGEGQGGRGGRAGPLVPQQAAASSGVGGAGGEGQVRAPGGRLPPGEYGASGLSLYCLLAAACVLALLACCLLLRTIVGRNISIPPHCDLEVTPSLGFNGAPVPQGRSLINMLISNGASTPSLPVTHVLVF